MRFSSTERQRWRYAGRPSEPASRDVEQRSVTALPTVILTLDVGRSFGPSTSRVPPLRTRRSNRPRRPARKGVRATSGECIHRRRQNSTCTWAAAPMHLVQVYFGTSIRRFAGQQTGRSSTGPDELRHQLLLACGRSMIRERPRRSGRSPLSPNSRRPRPRSVSLPMATDVPLNADPEVKCRQRPSYNVYFGHHRRRSCEPDRIQLQPGSELLYTYTGE